MIKTNVQKTAQVQPSNTQDFSPVATSMPDSVDLNAAPGVVMGKVVDQFSGQPLAGAIVRLSGSGRTVATDTRGFYRFPTAPAGKYGISVNYLGAEFRTQRIVVASGASVTQVFLLENQLDEMLVYGTGAYQLTDNFGVSATVQYRVTDGQNFDINPLFTEEQVLPAGFTSAFRLPERFNFPFDPEFVELLYTTINFFM